MDFKNQDRLEKVRQTLKNADDIEMRMPMNEDFFDNLQSKIMAEVEKTEIRRTPPLLGARMLLRSHWRSWRYPAGGITSLLVMVAIFAPEFAKWNQSMQRAGLSSDGRERIIEQALQDPDVLSQTLITAQSEADFFMDVASESFENLSETKFNKIMGESGR